MFVVATFNGGWLPLFNECTTTCSPTPLLIGLLDCWSSLVQQNAMGTCANELPSTEARNLLEESICEAMTTYYNLSNIWRTR